MSGLTIFELMVAVSDSTGLSRKCPGNGRPGGASQGCNKLLRRSEDDFDSCMFVQKSYRDFAGIMSTPRQHQALARLLHDCQEMRDQVSRRPHRRR